MRMCSQQQNKQNGGKAELKILFILSKVDALESYTATWSDFYANL